MIIKTSLVIYCIVMSNNNFISKLFTLSRSPQTNHRYTTIVLSPEASGWSSTVSSSVQLITHSAKLREIGVNTKLAYPSLKLNSTYLCV